MTHLPGRPHLPRPLVEGPLIAPNTLTEWLPLNLTSPHASPQLVTATPPLQLMSMTG